MLKVHVFNFSYFGVNTYLLVDEATNEAAVIDPAMQNDRERSVFDQFIEDNSIRLTQIINTHLHLDHCFGLDYVHTRYGVPVKAHPADAPLGANMSAQYRKFGMRGAPEQGVSIDVPLADGDTITIGESRLQVIHTPGHTPGGISLYCPEQKMLFSGDTLFRTSIGRTDLEGGDAATLERSIRSRLFTLPDDVTVLPGHDRHTTIGYEKLHNRYL